MKLQVQIKKKLGTFHLDAAFETEEGVFAILGASGCGKSMTLKCIAGIETPDEGKIVLDGKILFDSQKHINLPPQKRKFGYMFQDYALFPNMMVQQNIMAGMGKKPDKAVVVEYINRFQLSGVENLYPSQLFGGQKQRVAMARMLAAKPDVILLDEPFSALDYQTRLAVSADIYRIIRQEGKTALLVTHDISEAISLSDRVVVLSHRPAVVKSIHRLTQLQGVPPLQRRDHPAFAGYFKSIWKELEVHEE